MFYSELLGCLSLVLEPLGVDFHLHLELVDLFLKLSTLSFGKADLKKIFLLNFAAFFF